MKKVIFNVIIPVYNGENTVSRAINSVLEQTYKNVRIILVDDGSTDKSGMICDEYAANYDNIEVLHTSNQGVTSARNNGIRAVKEGYIAFLDADDYLDSNLFSEAGSIIEKYDPDCLDFGFKYVSKSGEILETLNNIEKNVLLNKQYIMDKILPPLLNLVDDKSNFIYDFAVNKIYKKSIIDENHIAFIHGRRIWEDRPFVIDYVSNCNTFYSLYLMPYNYVDTPFSLSRRFTCELFDVILENYILYKTKFGNIYDFETKYVYDYWCNAFVNMLKKSLSQNVVSQEEVKIKIIDIFSNTEVISLFSKRIAKDSDERAISQCILNGEIEKLIQYCKKALRKNHKKATIRMILSKLKNKITFPQ